MTGFLRRAVIVMQDLETSRFQIGLIDGQFHVVPVALPLPPFGVATRVGREQDSVGLQRIVQFLENPGKFLAGNMEERSVGEDAGIHG